MELLELMSQEDNSLYESVVRDALKNRILVFNDVVDDCIIENYIYYILKWNFEDAKIQPEDRKPIRMIINSPGGDAIASLGLVDVILSSITPIVGIGIGYVASAAFYIYMACHKRVAFENTVFLQHEGTLTVSNSHGKAKDTMEFIDEMEERIRGLVLRLTKMSAEEYDERYEKEYYMYASDAKKEGVVDLIIGEDVTIDYIGG